MSSDHWFRLIVGCSSAMPERDYGALGWRYPVRIGRETVTILFLEFVVVFCPLERSGEGVRHADSVSEERSVNGVVEFYLGPVLF